MARDARALREEGIITFAVGVDGAFEPELRVSKVLKLTATLMTIISKLDAQIVFYKTKVFFKYGSYVNHAAAASFAHYDVN